MCNYLSNKCGRKTCYVELNATDEISYASGELSHIGVDFFPSVTLQALPKILNLNYDYIILDFGTLNQYTMNEYERCNYKYAICPLQPWKKRSLENFLEMLQKNNNKYREHITLIGYTEIKEFKSKDIIGIPFFQNPFQITSNEFIHLEKVLERNNISR